MEIIFTIMIFLIGTVFGSFFTLAVYRIPLGKDITHERSFCPNCSHRLDFKDLIPVFSYIFLKGKCRYCKEKVRPRYFILEILSGLVFVLVFVGLRITIVDVGCLTFGMNFNNTLEKIMYFLVFVFFYITNTIIIGIDNERRKINKEVLNFGIITLVIYMLYLYIVKTQNMYRYGMYISLVILSIIISLIFKYKKINENMKYLVENILYLIYNLIFIESKFILLYCLISFSICTGYKIIKRKEKIQIPIGFCIGLGTIITFILQILI